MRFKDELFFVILRKFLTEYLPIQKHYSKNTIKAYKTAFNLFIDFLKERLALSIFSVGFSHLDHNVVLEYLDWIEISRHCGISTRNQRFFALKSFVRYAVMEDPTLSSIQLELDKVPVKKTAAKKIDFFSQNALKAILQQPDPRKSHGVRDRFLMILMYDTGARVQEILDLKVRDIITDEKHPYVYLTGKGAKTRLVPLMSKTVEHYKYYMDMFHPNISYRSDDYIFYTVIHGQRNQMSPDNVYHFMNRYASLARQSLPEVPDHVHPHMMRHTRAMDLYHGGMPLPLVQEFLGHSELKSTLIYAYADTEMKRVAIQKADNILMDKLETQLYDANNDEDAIRKLYGLKE